MEGIKAIGESLAAFQDDLKGKGDSLGARVREDYVERWMRPEMRAILALRTELVLALHEFLAGKGLLNLDRVSLSPITDPLCHDVESAPLIPYKNIPYRTTHSMIYSKMLACMNSEITGVFVDSPNLRLELASRSGQRGKYLIDFSQMDIELRRQSSLSSQTYFSDPVATRIILEEERERVLRFLEDAVVFATERLASRRSPELELLGVRIEPPKKPFPRFDLDEAKRRFGEEDLEAKIGREVDSQFFWILGLLRENYDLVYPFLDSEGRPRDPATIRSTEVFNYDLCASSLWLDGRHGGQSRLDGGHGGQSRKPDCGRDSIDDLGGEQCGDSHLYENSGRIGGDSHRRKGRAYEVLSGGLREWLFPIMVERLTANGVLGERPRFDASGEIENLAALEGYGPFLYAASLLDEEGNPLFPETAGGGLGIERCLFALLAGPKVSRIEEVTLFGKNPDSADLYLF